jgi:hypothetical protein
MAVKDLMGLLKVGQFASNLSEKELYAIAKLATLTPPVPFRPPPDPESRHPSLP